jgi:thioredoxin-related protein
MRKIIVFTLFLICCQLLSAQTNFRTLSYQEALNAAKAENKLVFIDFYTDWCGPCKLMVREVFPQKQVGDYFNAHFVCIKINGEKGEGIDLVKKIGLNVYPTFLIVNPDGNEVGRFEGYRPADQFVEDINHLIDPKMSPEQMKARYDDGERSASLLKGYAAYLTEKYSSRRMPEAQRAEGRALIAKMITDYFGGLTDEQRLYPENLFVYRTYTHSVSEPATRFMYAHRGQFGENNAEIDSVLNLLYRRELSRYVNGNNTYDAATFASLKDEMTTLGMTADGNYDSAFELVEAGSKGVDEYLAAFDRLYNQLNSSLRVSAMGGIENRSKGLDEATRKRAGRSIRLQLPDMTTTMMYSAFTILKNIEQPK